MLFSASYKKFIYTLIFTFPVLVFLIFLLLTLHKPLPVFPSPGVDIPIYPYKDDQEGGKSIIDAFEKGDDKLVFNYTLKKGIAFPYTGLDIGLLHNTAYLDLSDFDSFDLELETLNPTSVRIIFRFYIDNYTQAENYWSYGTLEKELLLEPQKNRYLLPLNSFTIPEWWYQKVSTPPPPYLKPDWKRIVSLNLDTSNAINLDRPESLTFRHLSFQKPVVSIYAPVLVICLFYFGGFTLWFLRLKKKNSISKTELIQGYQHTAITNYKDEELSKLIDFIKKNHADPDLSVNTIYSQLGINIKKMNRLIKENNLGNFKQLLNSFRIEEANQLLQTTDMKMMEIALAVGFSNVVHFNRVFREQTGMPPKEYRLKLKSKAKA